MNIILGKRVLDPTFLTGTSDFSKVGRKSATIFGVGTHNSGDRAKHVQILASRYNALEKRRIRICISQCSGEIQYRP